MAPHRPKILTRITVPTGGWDLNFIISDVGSLDTPLQATISAGDYYVAWDGQADDLLREVAFQMYTAIAAGPGGFRFPYLQLNESGKVVFVFEGADFSGAPKEDVELTWTTSNADLAKALGFDNTSDDQSIGESQAEITADWQHSHGWYANADGQLGSLLLEDISIVNTAQAIAYPGQSYCQYHGERWENALGLQWLTRALTFSRGISYGSAPVWPYGRNVPLECWWREAQQGTPFRVYPEGRLNEDAAVITVYALASTSAWVQTSAISVETEPQVHAGRIFHIRDRLLKSGNQSARFAIDNHTATVFYSVDTQPSSTNWLPGAGDRICKILDQRYRTYVVDLARMGSFSPIEMPREDYYDVSIPLLRYES